MGSEFRRECCRLDLSVVIVDATLRVVRLFGHLARREETSQANLSLVPTDNGGPDEPDAQPNEMNRSLVGRIVTCIMTLEAVFYCNGRVAHPCTLNYSSPTNPYFNHEYFVSFP